MRNMFEISLVGSFTVPIGRHTSGRVEGLKIAGLSQLVLKKRFSVQLVGWFFALQAWVFSSCPAECLI